MWAVGAYNQSMTIYIGADHGGYDYKQHLIEVLTAEGHELHDCGTSSHDSTDYPLYAAQLTVAVAADPATRGVLVCRSGEGMEMAANKAKGIRAALVWEKTVAAETRRDNDANVVVLPADFISETTAADLVRVFLATSFSGEERHIRRIKELHALEGTQYIPTV